jgi:hypothetical protein
MGPTALRANHAVAHWGRKRPHGHPDRAGARQPRASCEAGCETVYHFTDSRNVGRVTKRHNPISSLRKSATIIVLRILRWRCSVRRKNHWAKLLVFRNRRNPHVLRGPGEPLEHFEFLHEESSDPTGRVAERNTLLRRGSIVVWYASFEKGLNEGIAKRRRGYGH